MKPAMVVVNAANAREALNDLERKCSEYIDPAIYTEIYSDSTLVAVRATSIETARNHTARVLKDERARDKYARDNRSTDQVSRRGLSGKVTPNSHVMIVFELMERSEAETRKNQKLQLVRPGYRSADQKVIEAVNNGVTDPRTVQEAARTIKNEQRYLQMVMN